MHAIPRIVLGGFISAGLAASPAQGQQPPQQPEPTPSAQPTPPPPQVKPPEEPKPPPPEVKPEEPPAPDRPLTVSLRVRGEIGFESNLTDSPGKITIDRAGADIDVAIPVAKYAQLNLGFDYEHSHYDFHGATGFIAGVSSPFANVDRETLSARFAQHLSQEWSYFVGGNLLFSGEEGARFGDSIEGLFYAAPQYSFSDSLTVGLGVAVSTRLEKTVSVLPLPTFDWDITKRWNLGTNGEAGLTLTYTPSEDWAFSLGGHYEFRDFRLDKNGPLPGGVGRDTRIPVLLTAAWHPDHRISAEVGLGVYLGQNFELLDSSGNTVADIDADSAPFLMVRLGYRF